MQAFLTSTMLLSILRESNDERAWAPFVERYRPVIEALARNAGASADDAQDIAQSTLVEFVRAFRAGGYNRDRGRLRDWLYGIARHAVLRWRRSRGVANGIGRIGEDLTDESLDSEWDREWRGQVLLAALRQVRDEVEVTTFDVFDRVAVRGEPVVSVAKDLQMSPNAIYGAKRRVLERLREVSAVLETDW